MGKILVWMQFATSGCKLTVWLWSVCYQWNTFRTSEAERKSNLWVQVRL